MKKESTRKNLEEDLIYHVYNRGVEKRKIFLSDEDRHRFINGLFSFNNTKPALNAGRIMNKVIEVELQSEDTREKLVEILAFVLMPNHYHLLIKPLIKNGVTEFMRKVGTGYTNYFNIRHKRVGPLFQGKFKSILIESDEQLQHIPNYIHLNPIGLIEKNWKEKEIKNYKKAFDFAQSYPWSSLPCYLGKNDFPHIIDKQALTNLIDLGDYEEDLRAWLKDLNQIDWID